MIGHSTGLEMAGMKKARCCAVCETAPYNEKLSCAQCNFQIFHMTNFYILSWFSYIY